MKKHKNKVLVLLLGSAFMLASCSSGNSTSTQGTNSFQGISAGIGPFSFGNEPTKGIKNDSSNKSLQVVQLIDPKKVMVWASFYGKEKAAAMDITDAEYKQVMALAKKYNWFMNDSELSNKMVVIVRDSTRNMFKSLFAKSKLS